MDLSVIIVSWNVRELLAACLASVLAALDMAGLQGEIIVVDNASSDGTPGMVRECFPGVRLIEAGANLGYTGGNNLGLREARGRFLLILNPDTTLAPDALKEMVRFLEADITVGVVGPALRYADGTPQSSRRRFPGLLVGLIESTSLQPALDWLPPLTQYRMEEQPPDQPQSVDWLVGAALMVRREAVAAVGGFDDAFFMYFEEVDWQRRIKAAGWRICYLPSAQVVHFEGASSGQVVARRQLLFATSKLHYYRKWYGPAVAEALRGWLWLLFAWELLVESTKLLLRHKPELRGPRIAAYRALLASGLRRPE